MWKEVQISGKSHFLLLQINDETLDCDCILYDGNQSWHEAEKLTIITKRAKELNKRVQFDDATVKETLQNGMPIEAEWIEQEEASVGNSHLKLKYRVQSCPLSFTWYFCKQSEHDFQRFILFPLFRIVQGLRQQNEELREVVRKKDVEIVQYKTEGAKLKRKTVETQHFDFKKFDKKYAPTSILLEGINQISDLLKTQYTPMQMPFQSTETSEEGKKKEIAPSPRRRRRQEQELLVEKQIQRLKTVGKRLEYESSQSEQISSSSQEVVDADKIKNFKNSSSTSSVAEEKFKQGEHLSPSKYLRTRKDSKRDSSETLRSLRKRKQLSYNDYEESSQSSTEEKVDQISLNCISSEKPMIKSPVSEHISDDIKSIIDEWKALEQRRIADLKNVRTTRTGKCRST